MVGNRLAPAVPHWITMEREAEMQIDEGILKCSVFLGAPNERGFGAEGSGFFVYLTEEELDFTYVVTCRHVIQPFDPPGSTNLNPGKIWIRANTKLDRKPRTIETIRGEWFPHPDRTIDICAYPFDVRKWDADDVLDIGRFQIQSIVLHKELEETAGLSLGEEVFITGCFVGRIGESRNIPVVQIGNIAALPREPVWGGSPRHPAYLIETKSLGGISGSPVFLNTALLAPLRLKPKMSKTPDGQKISPYLLIAIMQGLHSGNYYSDFVGEREDQIIPPVPADVDFNAGIGIGIPVVHILETLNQPALKEARMATIQAKKKEVGYRPASSSPQTKVTASAPSEIPPSDRERFNSLLNAAAQKREAKD